MRLRRWFYAIASVFAVALVMFPLNFLWVGQSPLHAAVSSLLFGLPALALYNASLAVFAVVIAGLRLVRAAK